MDYLGTPHRVYYTAKVQTSGLGNIQALVFRPDGITSGPFALVPLPIMFSGMYYFDFLTSVSDPEGSYLAYIISPTEGVTDSVRFDLYTRCAEKPDISELENRLDDLTNAVDLISACVL